MKPLDLKSLFGSKYKIRYDESAYHYPSLKNDPTYSTIPCRHGHIYPYSDRQLAFHCTGNIIRNFFRNQHPEIEITNWTDDGEAIFLFTKDQFHIISEFANPRKKRILSHTHKEALTKAGTEALKRYRNSILGSKNDPKL